MQWPSKVRLPMEQALKTIEERYQIIIPKSKKEELINDEIAAIKKAWEDGFEVGDIGMFFGADVQSYLERTYINDTGSR